MDKQAEPDINSKTTPSARSTPADVTSAFAPQSKFRCVCGADLVIGSQTTTNCPECNRLIRLGDFDTSQTVSFCSRAADGLAAGNTLNRTGEELGHFQLLEPLGEGGMGAVYRALDESLQRYVAVKVIRAEQHGSTDSSNSVSRLLNEAIAQARLNHPNVVTIYYVGRKNEEPFLAMELLAGPTLEKRLEGGRLNYPAVVSYAQQVVSALRQAEQLGLVHGDIKPSNLIMADERTVKLGDFGLARTRETKPSEGISGTLNYMAQELYSGSEPTSQSDMYALGITLYELTFGTRPYRLTGTTLQEQISSQKKIQIRFPHPWPSDVPESWRLIIEKLAAKAPQDRFENYGQLQQALLQVAPMGTLSAGVINRAFAWLVDTIFQNILFIPFGLLLVLAPEFERGRVMSNVLALLSPLVLGAFGVPAFFLWLEYAGYRTLGRYIFQQRVADKNGLPLTRRKRLARSFLRNALVWAQALAIALPGTLSITRPVLGLASLYTLANLMMMLGPKRLAVHDRVVNSHVVLDSVFTGHQHSS